MNVNLQPPYKQWGDCDHVYKVVWNKTLSSSSSHWSCSPFVPLSSQNSVIKTITSKLHQRGSSSLSSSLVIVPLWYTTSGIRAPDPEALVHFNSINMGANKELETIIRYQDARFAIIKGRFNGLTTVMREGKHIFLYGGLNIDWIRKFTATSRDVAREANIPLEMVYVGGRSYLDSAREKVQEIIHIINMEKLSSCWPDMAMIWFFWTRVESMFLSRIQLEKGDDEAYPSVQQKLRKVRKVIAYDSINRGWALLAKGSTLIDSWIQQEAEVAFKNYVVDKSPVSSSSQRPADSG
ncbi:hypothetical protein RJ640_017211 [Escallonia rubra]|uniref:Sieve element occlusion C-terminal domain-containing protein n=1 Tax=Escallonia rubra TaxID=112253 RepID=A0AA88RWK8_9ASTE|nr:hypothetical protein RJ640_017211 [Escallonia rubra]